MSALDDVVSTGQGAVRNIGQLVGPIQTIASAIATGNPALLGAVQSIATAILQTFPRVNGSFTLGNATTTVVTQSGITASGFPLLTPFNATAALLLRTQGLYVSAVTAGVSFSVSTQTGVAAGSEAFKYIVFNPL